MRPRLALLALAVALGACQTPAAPPDDAARPDSGDAAGGAAAVPVDTTGGPPMPYVAAGACPFECCTYGDWRTTAPLRVSATERGTDVAFTLPAGTAVRADTGNVYVDAPGHVVADHAFPLGFEEEAPDVTVAQGDTLYVLDNLGEGFVRVWYRGRTHETDGRFWNWQNMIEPQDPEQRYGRLLDEPRTSWWAHVTDPQGRSGWVDMDAAEFLEGVDACGG